MVTLLPGTTRSHIYLREEEDSLRQRVHDQSAAEGKTRVSSAVPVAVELQVTRHLPVRHRIRRLLQAESLKVNANAAVWDDEVGVHGALHPSNVLTGKRGKKNKTLDKMGKNNATVTKVF